MTRVIFLALALLLAMLASPASTDAKPFREPFHLVYAQPVGCGPDCVPDDGIIGPDEGYKWKAEGVLSGTFVHSYDTIQSRVAQVSVWWKGKGEVELDIDCEGCLHEWAETYSSHKGRRGINHINGCFEHYGGTIIVTITGKSRGLSAAGWDEMLFRPSTFEC